jgi:hypothetical protein
MGSYQAIHSNLVYNEQVLNKRVGGIFCSKNSSKKLNLNIFIFINQ